MVPSAVLALKPVNDTELLDVIVTLPSGFGYVINELNVNITQDRAASFEAEGVLIITDSSRQNQDFDYRIPIPFINFSNQGTNLQARATRVPAGSLTRVPIIPGAAATTLRLRFSNLDATVAAAGVVNALMSFWEFDLQQLQYFPAHVSESVTTR